MKAFYKNDNVLFCEAVSCETITQRYGTPVYVYSRNGIERQWHLFNLAFGSHPHEICYAVKACSNVAILNLLAKLGSGFDVVSGGELERVRHAGGDLSKVVFSGVGKTVDEIELAIKSKIKCLDIESQAELKAINQVASHLDEQVSVGLRINPDIDAKTHPYIATGMRDNKFGVCFEEAQELTKQLVSSPYLQLIGVACHIGSQITDLKPFCDAAQRLVSYADTLSSQGAPITQIDFGGGYSGATTAPSAEEYISVFIDAVGKRNYKIIIEPGRSIVGENGVLLTKAMYLKQQTKGKKFVIVDAAMNDLIRPALYQAKHAVQVAKPNMDAQDRQEAIWDIVGPVCESGDFLAQDCPIEVATGDVLALMSAGAYGFSMASNYNSRPRVAEVLVDGDKTHLIGQRETFADLIKNEHLLK